MDYPHTGPPTRIDAISPSTGHVRTVVASLPNAFGGDGIIPTFVAVYGSQVYFRVARAGTFSLFRAPLSGGGAPEKLIDYPSSATGEIIPSPDGGTLAWPAYSFQFPVIVTHNLTTRAEHLYPLQRRASRVRWSPSGRTIVADAPQFEVSDSLHFQWLDIPTAAVRLWLAPRLELGGISQAFGPDNLDLGWDGDAPVLYGTAGTSVNRYVLASGAVKRLSSLSAAGPAVGWNGDFSSAVVSASRCDKYSAGAFAGDCIQWKTTADRVGVRSGTSTNVVRLTTRDQVFIHADPTLAWLACVWYTHTKEDGLYIQSLPR